MLFLDLAQKEIKAKLGNGIVGPLGEAMVL